MQVPRDDGLFPDRFVEVDLDWFDSDENASVEEFVGQVAPLLHGRREHCGVVLNTGFLVDILTEFDGDLATTLPLRSQRCRQWSERSYRDLRDVVRGLRRAAVSEGLTGMRVGLFVAGIGRVVTGTDLYDLESDWCDRHPELYPFDLSPLPGPDLDPRVALHADSHRYASRPTGISEGTRFADFLADQWAAVAAACEFDTIHLRDGFWGPMLYTRKGPYGVNASSDPTVNASWTTAIADLFATVKRARPDALVMAYTSGIGATGEWRCGCVDSEAVLAAGGVDILIDQTWGGAWQDWWDDWWKGWTNQHANLLSHAVAVRGADRTARQTGDRHDRIRHYKLIETWDGWEPFDTVHVVPQKLRWAMWAWSHAAVVTPDGLEVCDGSYISWMNDRDLRLLDTDAVAFVADELEAAETSASRMSSVGGPLAVFDRAAVVELVEHHADEAWSEHLEDAMALLLKWGVPILAATRAEWFDPARSRGAVVQGGRSLPGDGRWPTLMVGRAESIESDIVTSAHETSTERSAGYRRERFTDGGDLPTTGWVHHAPSGVVTVGPDASVLATAGDEPFLVADDADNLAWWLPPELADPSNPLLPRSQYGSVASAAAAARWLAARSDCRVDPVPFAEPVTVLTWSDVDDTSWVLAGNLEAGWVGDARTPRRVGIEVDTAESDGFRIELTVPGEGCTIVAIRPDASSWQPSASTALGTPEPSDAAACLLVHAGRAT